MKALAVILALAVFGASAGAAGIDSRVYRCADLRALIAATGFVFISQPAFGDFVVSSQYYCSGVDRVQLRSVPTADNPECVINYCVPPPEHFN